MSNKNIEKAIKAFKSWVGYCEKNNHTQLGTYEEPEHFSKNAGSGNFTVFAKEFKKYNFNVQGMPWCDTFIDVVFIKTFGSVFAKKMLCGFSAYTPESENFFKKADSWHENPKVGDIVFFKNNVRTYHTGFVIEVSDTSITTIEGNTSDGQDVVPNGGKVCIKKYLKTNPRISGYGRPDYFDVDRWYYIDSHWMYFENGEPLKDVIRDINKLYFAFDEHGRMRTEQFFKDGKRYVPCSDGMYQGALLKIVQ